jgi:hypothetical protein
VLAIANKAVLHVALASHQLIAAPILVPASDSMKMQLQP